jgi:hypothetical protein
MSRAQSPADAPNLVRPARASRAVTVASTLFLVLGAFGTGGTVGCYSGATDSGEGVLSAAYALVSVDGAPLPVVLSIAGAEERRFIADTLRFPTPGFYTETVISQATSGTSPPVERFDRDASPYSDLGGNSIQLPVFAGIAGTANVSASTLTVFGAQGRIWTYSVVR